MPRRDRPPLHDIHGAASGRVSTTPWDANGVAAVEASGTDVRSALEAGLRGVLRLCAGSAEPPPASDRSTPLQGEGFDLAELFLDLIEDLLDQLALSPYAGHDVAIDGVLHREGGGYVAWGYLAESTAPAPPDPLPLTHQMPGAASTPDGIVFRATLIRDAP